MRFGELSALPYDDRTGKPSYDALAAAFPGVPAEVLSQFYLDHGRNPDFIAQYADLDLEALVWERAAYPAELLVAATRYRRFDPWFESVRKRFLRFPEQGWKAIDSRSAVVSHWEQRGTWALPPIFLAGSLLRPEPIPKLHLAEGHTRLATLSGAVESGLVSPDSLHVVWIGNGPNRGG